MKLIYKAGYKYQNKEDYYHQLPLKPPHDIATKYIFLSAKGIIEIAEGYAWDGPSGPTFHTKSFMRGSLVHDALYQLMRDGHLPIGYRDAADKILKDICIEDGMPKFRAWYIHLAVKTFGKPYTDPKNDHPLEVAP